jgi:hypothetical protein
MREKRRHKRVPIAASATLRFKNKESSPSVDAMVGSISISGIGLYTDKHIEENTDILLEIKFISVDGNMYSNTASGRIVYVNIIGGINYTGIEFDELVNPAGQPDLYKHLFTVMQSSFNES